MLAGGSRLWRSTNIKSGSPAWTPITGCEGHQLHQRDCRRAGSIGCRVGRRATWARSTAPRTVPAPSRASLGESPDARQLRLAHRDQRGRFQRCLRRDRQLRIDQRRQDRRTAERRGRTPPARQPPDCPTCRSTICEIDPANPNTIYAGTEVGVFVSQDGGATWDLPQDGPANVSVDELFWMGAHAGGGDARPRDVRGRLERRRPAEGCGGPGPARLRFGGGLRTERTAARDDRQFGGLPLTIYSLSIDGPHVDYSIAGPRAPARCRSAALLGRDDVRAAG